MATSHAPAPVALGSTLLALEERQAQRQQQRQRQRRTQARTLKSEEGTGVDAQLGGDETEHENSVSTGCKCIDEALEGGFRFGEITSIAASESKIKNLISYHTLITHLLARPASEAVVVDTTGAFAVQTLRDVAIDVIQSRRKLVEGATSLRHEGYVYQVSAAASANNFAPELDDEVNALLERVKLVRVFDLAGLTDIVGEISSLSRETDNAEDADKSAADLVLDLLIIDDLSAVVQPILARNNVEAQSLLVSLHRPLTYMVQSGSMAAIVFRGLVGGKRVPDASGNPAVEDAADDQVSRFPSVSSRPALGKSIAHLVDLETMIISLPRDHSDAEAILADRSMAAERDHVNVLEILSDRSGSRHRNIAAFVANGLRLEGLSAKEHRP